ncbi:hypothetical protein Ga0074812_123103 [Parafrankia irregularis]|uniref:Uncharacterized protein n=1 Tax=Parafrankia irregularis TaxID=795642 RepID=A0A0S4QV67_9ACTN|nr:hypothetical protein Ga0074812_123103 [Parafrankia irregularis]
MAALCAWMRFMVAGVVDGMSVASMTVVLGAASKILRSRVRSRSGAPATETLRAMSFVPMCSVTMFGW